MFTLMGSEINATVASPAVKCRIETVIRSLATSLRNFTAGGIYIVVVN